MQADIKRKWPIAALTLIDVESFELSRSIVLIPGGGPIVATTANCDVDVTVSVKVRGNQRMRPFNPGVDFNCLENRPLEPEDAFAVASRRDNIQLAVSINFGWIDVRSTGLLIGQHMLLPNVCSVRRLLPPRKPLAARKRFAFRAAGYVWSAIVVEIAQPHVM